MSSGSDPIIICGSGGSPVTDKTITVYDAPFSVAIKISKADLENELVAKGVDPDKAARQIERFARRVENDWYSWGEDLERLGIDYERHVPHVQP